jgi:transposase
MSLQVTKNSYEGLPIYIGLDVHKNSWKASFSTSHTVQKTITVEKPFVINLIKYLQKHFPDGEYICAYEAGFSGFWAQEELQIRGVKTIVVNPADIPTSDKERQYKNDKRDSKKICSTLRSGELEGIYVPTKQAQKDRSIVRTRYQIMSAQSRVKQQIRSSLNFYGIEIEQGLGPRYWSRKFIAWLEKISKEKELEGLKLQIKFLLNLREQQLEATRSVKQLSKEPRHEEVGGILNSVPGVGMLTMMLLITEIIEMKRFKSEDKLMSYVGLIPTTNSSGDSESMGEITKRANKRIRKALIESSWVAIRKDPELLIKYENLRKRMGAYKAIIKIARILMRKIRRVWIKKEVYLITEY